MWDSNTVCQSDIELFPPDREERKETPFPSTPQRNSCSTLKDEGDLTKFINKDYYASPNCIWPCAGSTLIWIVLPVLWGILFTKYTGASSDSSMLAPAGTMLRFWISAPGMLFYFVFGYPAGLTTATVVGLCAESWYDERARAWKTMVLFLFGAACQMRFFYEIFPYWELYGIGGPDDSKYFVGEYVGIMSSVYVFACVFICLISFLIERYQARRS